MAGEGAKKLLAELESKYPERDDWKGEVRAKDLRDEVLYQLQQQRDSQGGVYGIVNKGMGEAREWGTELGTKGLTSLGMSEPLARPLAEVANPIPGSVPEAATLALTGPGAKLAGNVIKGAGRVATVGRNVAGGAAAGAASFGTDAMVRGQGPLDAAVEGAKGTIPGAIYGATRGGIQAIAGPNRHTQTASLIIDTLRASQRFSPSVVKSLDNRNPLTLYEGQTVRNMQAAASDQIDSQVDRIAKQVGLDVRIELPAIVQEMFAKPSPEIGSALKIRGVEIMTNIQGQPVTALAKVKDAQKLVRDMRARGDYDLARRVEDNMLDYLDTLIDKHKVSATLGDAYRTAKAQYKNDARAIDIVTELQKRQGRLGGINPVDFPEAGKVSKLTGDEGHAFGDIGHGVAGLGLAATGHAYSGAYHTARMLEGMAKRGGIDATKVTSMPGKTRVNLGKWVSAGFVGPSAAAAGMIEP